jgi:acyl carrier protein
MKDDAIDLVLIKLAAAFTPLQIDEIQMFHSFSRDLKMDSDELSFHFAPLVENAFGKKISLEKWKTLNSLQDLANELRRLGQDDNFIGTTESHE